MREWDDSLKILKDKNCHPTILYPASLSLRCKRKKKKYFPQQKLKESINTRPALAPHSSTLAWKIPWMEKPGRLQSMGLLRVGHD